MAVVKDIRVAAIKARVAAHGHELLASDGVREPVSYSIMDPGVRVLTGVVAGSLDDVAAWLAERERVELEHRRAAERAQ